MAVLVGRHFSPDIDMWDKRPPVFSSGEGAKSLYTQSNAWALMAAFIVASLAPSALFGMPMLETDAVVTAAKLVPECGAQDQSAEAKIRETCERLDRHIQWLEMRLEAACTDAGERIVRTVADVEGLYVKPPSRDPNKSFGRFHEDDRTYMSWMSPRRGRHYSLWEADSFRAPGMIEQRRHEIVPQGKARAKVNEPYQQVVRPSAKYGVTWRALGERADWTRGFHGDETIVFEVATGEVLAVRRFYYYTLQPHVVDEAGMALGSQHWRSRIPEFIKPCRNYRPREERGYIDLRPRDSHEFVSRVLKPKALSDEAAVGTFDLARGSGTKEGGCMVASFGPRIGPQDVELVRIDDHGLKTTVKGTGDSLYCPTFYQPGGHSRSSLYRFYDGRVWTLVEIDKAASMNPRMLTPLRPATSPQAPGTPPDLRFNMLAAPPSARHLVPDCRDMSEQPADSPKRRDCERLDRHVERAEARLAALCTDAGERITRTVADVEGVFVKQPPTGSADLTFHGEDRHWIAFMSPVVGRHYTVWESNSLGTGGKIAQYRNVMIPKGKERPIVTNPQQVLEQPTAKYGVTWASIGDGKERSQGIYGDETTVFEVATGNALATRRVYYYALRPGLVDENGQPLQSPHWSQGRLPDFVQTCRNYRLKENRIYNDFRPRDSYEFVARVLKPKPVSNELAVGLFDLARGTGTKLGACAFVTLGPHIGPQDLDVTYVEDNSIKIAIKNTRDALMCNGFYASSRRQLAHQVQLRFYDGSSWTFDDIDRRTDLRARVLAATVAMEVAPRSAPVTFATPALPAVERGLWKLKIDINGKARQEDYCGDPLGSIASDLSGTSAMGSLGCGVHSTTPSPRAVNMVIECPDDRVSKDGSTSVRKGRTDLSLAAPSPTSFTLRVRRTADGYRQTIEGKRVGNCE
jgi:hypothetical protein